MPESMQSDRIKNDDGIYCYLVRYGALGHVSRVGAIRHFNCRRGDRVVIRTDRGMELAEVLEVTTDQTVLGERQGPAGELLRLATETDWQQEARGKQRSAQVLAACTRELGQRALAITAVDAEQLLDGQTIVVYYLGEPTFELGPLAVDLNRVAGDARVQFQRVEEPAQERAEEPSDPATDAPDKRSKQERIKQSSCYLRGTIWEELASDGDKFSPPAVSLLKFHGTYQQDDRDARKRRSPGAGRGGKQYIFMVRTKVPGGRMTAGQLLSELELCDRFANGTLRITSRQGLQLHGVSKANLWRTMHDINQALLTTAGACGDVVRNVMCCPAPLRDDRIRSRMQSTAAEISRHLAPRTSAYREIWIDGEKQEDARDREPVYGPNYLPRKFKIGIAHPEDNCIDVYTQDIGLLAVIGQADELVGYNVLAGGGLGNSPSVKDTFPRLADPLAFVSCPDILRVVTAIVEVQRDFGNRDDRRRARMKYLIEQWGVKRFKEKVEEYFHGPLDDPRPVAVRRVDDHLGWQSQGDGKFFLGLFIENGRIQDSNAERLKRGLCEVLRHFRMPVRLTPQQNLLLCDLELAWKDELLGMLADHGIRRTDQISCVRRHGMACPALPTCGLAITEAERVLPGVIDRVEKELSKLGLDTDEFSIRMTGCPNACSRPYTADIGLVGKAAGKYTILLGGRMLGDRLNFIYKDMVGLEEVVDRLLPLLAYFRSDREPQETLGDFCQRKGLEELLRYEAEWPVRTV